jgi:hypothetical protein
MVSDARNLLGLSMIYVSQLTEFQDVKLCEMKL